MKSWDFLEQSNISAKNIARLRELVKIEDAAFQTLRQMVLEIALIAPRKRHRRKRLDFDHPDLLRRATNEGLVEEYNFDCNFDCNFDFGETSLEVDGVDPDEQSQAGDPVW